MAASFIAATPKPVNFDPDSIGDKATDDASRVRCMFDFLQGIKAVEKVPDCFDCAIVYRCVVLGVLDRGVHFYCPVFKRD